MSDIVNKNENLELELDDNTILSNLFGINDRNLSLIEKINQVKIQYRGNKIKIWYMHEDVGLDSKLFTGSNSDGEVNWYGIRYKTGPMEFQYSYGDSDANEGPTYDRDGYNIGMYYKLSKTSRIYLAHSKSDAGSGDGANLDIESTLIGLRHDF